ncbi:unnamed protein product [Peronospora farinosa]|uniref:Uncharacterized protein n=1 Tax=Peronospora farinosa TaxID=134698 RepID=A0AAV0SSI6_9STRA|nr:unnamed protein product [Peronospora farinosa]
MLSRLLEAYDIGPLVVAATRAPKDKVALRVEAEIRDLWFWLGRTLDYAFTNLGLDKAGDTLFENHLLPFWTSYLTYYNSNVHETLKVSMCSILEKHSRPYLKTLLYTVKNPDVTLHLEEELKNKMLKIWTDDETPVVRVLLSVIIVKTEGNENTLYGSALQKAAGVYINRRQ